MDVSVSQHLPYLPLLVCHGCKRQVALPHRNPEAIVLGQSYLPTGDRLLAFLCPYCDSLYAYSESDVLRQSAPTSDPVLPLGVALQVGFSCAQENCGLRIAIHTIGEQGISRDAITKKVGKANPRPTCANGHSLPVNQYIERLDVVG